MNLVFDLGGVVVTWDPDGIVASVFRDPEERRLVRAAVFAHPDWLELDQGVLDQETAITRAAARTRVPKSRISELFERVPPSLVPIVDTVALIRSLKKPGNRLFILSNMPLASMEYMERTLSFWDLFDGIVVSSRIHMIKPDPGIFRYLLNEYSLRPSETIFIDDTDVNLTAAAALGMKTVEFIDAVQCERALRGMGCITA